MQSLSTAVDLLVDTQQICMRDINQITKYVHTMYHASVHVLEISVSKMTIQIFQLTYIVQTELAKDKASCINGK